MGVTLTCRLEYMHRFLRSNKSQKASKKHEEKSARCQSTHLAVKIIDNKRWTKMWIHTGCRGAATGSFVWAGSWIEYFTEGSLDAGPFITWVDAFTPSADLAWSAMTHDYGPVVSFNDSGMTKSIPSWDKSLSKMTDHGHLNHRTSLPLESHNSCLETQLIAPK